MKNLVKLLYMLLYLRPNCLLTRKPIWILTRSNRITGDESTNSSVATPVPQFGDKSIVQSSEPDDATSSPDFILRLRYQLMKWQIQRHGYKIDSRSNWAPRSDWEHAQDAHEIDYCHLSVFAVLDYLILLAEEDYLEVK